MPTMNDWIDLLDGKITTKQMEEKLGGSGSSNPSANRTSPRQSGLLRRSPVPKCPTLSQRHSCSSCRGTGRVQRAAARSAFHVERLAALPHSYDGGQSICPGCCGTGCR